MMYDLGVGTVQQQYTDLIKLQQQMATGRRVLNPSDDPIASARALEVTQSQSVNEQFTKNGEFATSTLGFQESILAQAGELLQNVRTLAVNAGDAALSNLDRAAIATELRGHYDQLLGLANSTDGNGQYIFSGFKGSTQPFSQGVAGVVYNGDQGQRVIQISASRQSPVSSSGAEVFQQIRNGNGTFVTAAAAANTGAAIIGPGAVQDPALWTASNRNFTISFTSDTTYDVIDNGPLPPAAPGVPVTLVTGATYTSGTTISVQGAEFDLSGIPAAGDTFSIQASRTDQDIFKTISDLITSLGSSASGSAGNAKLINNLNTALSNLDRAQDSMLTVRAAVGATMKEVEAQATTNDELGLQYKSTLSGLQDLDYAKAISDLALKQANLEAAQKSFLRIQGLSLFNYING